MAVIHFVCRVFLFPVSKGEIVADRVTLCCEGMCPAHGMIFKIPSNSKVCDSVTLLPVGPDFSKKLVISFVLLVQPPFIRSRMMNGCQFRF